MEYKDSIIHLIRKINDQQTLRRVCLILLRAYNRKPPD